MVHREYENNYPQWSDEILSIAQQIYKIDPRWGLKLAYTPGGHILIR
jgi:hypothetical protein